MQPKDWEFIFIGKEQVSKDAYTFSFDTKNTDFTFLPGQYIRIFLPQEHPDERGIQRLFTIATSPIPPGALKITTRIIQSTFKKTFVDLVPGTKVKFFGPMGQFIFKDEESQPHIFLAGGIGITPFLSMIPYIAEKKLLTKIFLFASFSTRDEFVYFDRMLDIAKNNSNIKVIYTVTHPEQSTTPWDGETGRITPDLIKRYAPEFSGALYYIAGPQIMVEAMEKMVELDMNIPKQQVRKEQFTGY